MRGKYFRANCKQHNYDQHRRTNGGSAKSRVLIEKFRQKKQKTKRNEKLLTSVSINAMQRWMCLSKIDLKCRGISRVGVSFHMQKRGYKKKPIGHKEQSRLVCFSHRESVDKFGL